MKRKVVIGGVVLLLLVGVLTALWFVLDWPPPRLILKYGLPPAGGPTGRTWTNSLGMEFVELRSGYFGDLYPNYPGDGDSEQWTWLDELGRRLGLSGRRAFTVWFESPEEIWISTEPICVPPSWDVGDDALKRLAAATLGAYRDAWGEEEVFALTVAPGDFDLDRKREYPLEWVEIPSVIWIPPEERE